MKETDNESPPNISQDNSDDFDSISAINFPKDLEGKSLDEIKQILSDIEKKHEHNEGKFKIQTAVMNNLIKLYNDSIIENLELATCHLDNGYELDKDSLPESLQREIKELKNRIEQKRKEKMKLLFQE